MSAVSGGNAFDKLQQLQQATTKWGELEKTTSQSIAAGGHTISSPALMDTAKTASAAYASIPKNTDEERAALKQEIKQILSGTSPEELKGAMQEKFSNFSEMAGFERTQTIELFQTALIANQLFGTPFNSSDKAELEKQLDVFQNTDEQLTASHFAKYAESDLETNPESKFRGTLSRSEAESVLKGAREGSSILRKSTRANDYVLSVVVNGKVEHFVLDAKILSGQELTDHLTKNNWTMLPKRTSQYGTVPSKPSTSAPPPETSNYGKADFGVHYSRLPPENQYGSADFGDAAGHVVDTSIYGRADFGDAAPLNRTSTTIYAPMQSTGHSPPAATADAPAASPVQSNYVTLPKDAPASSQYSNVGLVIPPSDSQYSSADVEFLHQNEADGTYVTLPSGPPTNAPAANGEYTNILEVLADAQEAPREPLTGQYAPVPKPAAQYESTAVPLDSDTAKHPLSEDYTQSILHEPDLNTYIDKSKDLKINGEHFLYSNALGAVHLVIKTENGVKDFQMLQEVDARILTHAQIRDNIGSVLREHKLDHLVDLNQ